MLMFLVFFRISVWKAKHIVQSYKSQWMNTDTSAGQWCWSSASGIWIFACEIKYPNMEKLSSENTLRAYLTPYTWLIKVNPTPNLFRSQNFWFRWTTMTLCVFCRFTTLYCSGTNPLCLFKNLHKKWKGTGLHTCLSHHYRKTSSNRRRQMGFDAPAEMLLPA